MKEVRNADDWRRVNEIKRLFDFSCRADVVNISASSTHEHEVTKALVCIELAKRGHHFLTEAKFSYRGTPGRADVVDLTSAQIIEILHSEKPESIEKKRNFYPLPLYAVRAEDYAWGITRIRNELDEIAKRGRP